MENYELLRDLYAIHSPSGKEKKMRKFIKDYIKRNMPDVKLSYDDKANIYATKGVSETYPCVVSHIDQVQDDHERDFRSYVVDGKVFGFSPCVMKMRGLGADDKNGIWVCLNVLAKFDVVKCAFFVGEEIGCVGSSGCDMSFFDDCRFVLQCDRRNGGDLITSICGRLCSKEFLDDIDYAKFGYKETSGLTTDVGTLKSRGLKVSCVNMSCGYYCPHTDEEYTVLSELDNCLAFVEHIITKCRKVYPHEKEPYSFWDEYDRSYFGGYGGFGMHGYYGSRGSSYGNAKKDYYYDHKKGHYVYGVIEEEEPTQEEQDYEDMNSIIFDDVMEGKEDDVIIDDVRLFFPDYDDDTVQSMINDVRKSYLFTHRS